MAFWGPPFTAEAEHATLACLSALDQFALLPEFHARLADVLGIVKNVPTFRIRMGIACGDLTIGSIGSDATSSYTVIGDTVNLAARLESVNKQYHTQILINNETRQLANAAIEVREVDIIRVSGKTTDERVFELLGRKGNISPVVADLRQHYETGLGLYRAQQWNEAIATFEHCLTIVPGDGPSELLLERTRKLRTHPPGESWNGVWTLTEK